MQRHRAAVGRLLGWAFLAAICLTPPTAAQDAPTAFRQPRLWAIVVGINSQIDPGIPKSRTSVRQAEDVINWLKTTAGWDAGHLLLLKDGGADNPGDPAAPAPSLRPSRKNLDWAFQVWLKEKQPRPDDVILVFYAGRSVALASPGGGATPPGLQYMFLPDDAFLASAAQTGWSLDNAIDPYARRGQFRIVCWLGTNPREIAAPNAPGAPPRPVRPGATIASGRDWLNRLTRWPKVTTWLAADQSPAGEFAPNAPRIGEDPAVAFTSAILQALGKTGRRPNLAACLKILEQNPTLKLAGFRAAGGVAPDLLLWADRFGRLAERGPPEMLLQSGHAGKVTAMVVSADGRRLVTAGTDGNIRIWALDQRSLLRLLRAHNGGVSALALSNDGRWLISGGGRGTVRFYSVTADYAVKEITREPHIGEEGQTTGVTQIIPLPDGDHVVTIDQNAASYIWDLRAAVMEPKKWLEGVGCREAVCGGTAENGVVAARCGDGSLRLFKADGSPLANLEGLAPAHGAAEAMALAVSLDARRVAMGFANGNVLIHDIATSKNKTHSAADKAVRKLVFAGTENLIVGHDGGTRLMQVGPGLALDARGDLTDRGVADLAVSPDGRTIAACTEGVGAAHAWVIEGEKESKARPLFHDDKAAVFNLLFAGSAGTLVGSGIDVSVKMWDLDAGAEAEAGALKAVWQSPISGGKVQQVGSSPDRRFLFVRSGVQGRLWDLNNRSCRAIPGTWASGGFSAENTLVLASASDSEKAPGKLARIDCATLTANTTYFANRAEGFSVPENTAFESLTFSPDRTLVAAADAQGPLVCIWEMATGRLLHWTNRLDDPANALSFSGDGKKLVVAGGSADVLLWNLAGLPSPSALKEPAAKLVDPQGSTVTAACIRPGAALEIVTGHRDGRVLLWRWKDGQPPERPVPVVEDYFDGAVNTLAFSADGKTLAAAGDGTSIWLGQIDPLPRKLNEPGPRPNHHEQINDLLFWDNPKILISAGDDAAVKFWDLDKRALWGTLAVVARRDEPGVIEPNWVLFTPEGRFDASPAGRELVRYRDGDASRPLEQYDGMLYTFRLAARLREGLPPVPEPKLPQPATLTIMPPVRDNPDDPSVNLTVALDGTEGLTDLRLYHNGVPIPTRLEEKPGPPPPRISVKVHLMKGLNRFYAMASREGAPDGRSSEIEIRYNGPMPPGRVHVIALGVGDYERLRLTYARSDAESISDILHSRGAAVDGKKGLVSVLTNKDVSREALDQTFREVAARVRDRPQDTVVVFLAGHTGILEDQRFCLLLPSYPFPKAEPLQVAMRGAVNGVEPGAKLLPEHTLPYTAIMTNMMRLEALNRLVIVDACQAEAIFVDPQVVEISKWMELGSRKARTSYLMAARKGDPAVELDPLRHGLLTFTLLRGMGAIPDEQIPEEIKALSLAPDADFNHDNNLTTGELKSFVEQALPQISAIFPSMVDARRRAVLLPKATRPAANQDDQNLRVQQASEASFPLMPIR